MEKSSFGKQLEQFLLQMNVKNSSIAKELNYDVSYISKWLTGKSLPSKKNIEKILTVISEVLVEQSAGKGKEELLEHFGVKNEIELKDAIVFTLRDAYYDTMGEVDERLRINNAFLKISPKGQFPLLEEISVNLKSKEYLNIAVMVDLFALDHVTKLKMAGIKEHRFILKEMREDITIDYIINISSLEGKSVYDVILLIHMMTCFSMTNFHLHYNPVASGKMLQAVEGEYAGITLLGDNKQFICTTSTKDKRVVGEIFENIKEHIDPDKSIFMETDMENLLLSHEYMQTLLSQNARWLVGHLTEHFISPELFEELSKEYFTGELRAEAERVYKLSKSNIEKNQIQIMIYNLALMDFVLSGELDFFNQKVVLSPEQRKKELLYLRKLLHQMNREQIKLVNEGFSDDFKYVTNPCMFLSGSLGYLRLENKQYKHNLMLVRDEKMRQIFDTFFGEIWNERQNTVVSDMDIIIKKIDKMIEASDLLNTIE